MEFPWGPVANLGVNLIVIRRHDSSFELLAAERSFTKSLEYNLEGSAFASQSGATNYDHPNLRSAAPANAWMLRENFMQSVDLKQKFALIHEQWRPKVAAEFNGQEVRLVKIQGVFPWHHHDEDELFLVWRGKMRIEFRDRIVELSEGQLCTVSRGLEHRTAADAEAEVLTFDSTGTLNTGNLVDPHFTAPKGVKI